ncbi:MAG: hypothetical protein ACI3VA_07480 [Candidatus Limivicinus sp.]
MDISLFPCITLKKAQVAILKIFPRSLKLLPSPLLYVMIKASCGYTTETDNQPDSQKEEKDERKPKKGGGRAGRAAGDPVRLHVCRRQHPAGRRQHCRD